METIEEVIRRYVTENIMYSSDGFPYADNVSFLDAGIIDSMNVMEIVMFIEENFDIQVKDEDITPDHFDSVRGLADYIRSARRVSV